MPNLNIFVVYFLLMIIFMMFICSIVVTVIYLVPDVAFCFLFVLLMWSALDSLKDLCVNQGTILASSFSLVTTCTLCIWKFFLILRVTSPTYMQSVAMIFKRDEVGVAVVLTFNAFLTNQYEHSQQYNKTC